MSSKKEEERNEKIIRGLLKLPPNRKCLNCNSLGPQYVCTNFWTFVCVTCSGIHREFTHRVKSVSMARFTSKEVEALQKGGNQRAKEVFLCDWDSEQMRLPDSGNVSKIREFIRSVYVDKKYAGGKSSSKPPRDTQSTKNHEEHKRASSYHSFSQSPPYEDQYEERRFGKQAGILSRKPGSDHGRYESKISSFIYSPGRQGEEAYEEKFANETPGSRNSDYSNTSPSFRPDGQSPKSETGHASPPFRQVRDILIEDSKSPASNPFIDANAKKDDVMLPSNRTLSSSSFGSLDNSNSANLVETNRSSLVDIFLEPEHSSVTQRSGISLPSGSLPISTSPNTVKQDFLDLHVMQKQTAIVASSVDQFSISPELPTITPSVEKPSSAHTFSESVGWATFDFPNQEASALKVCNSVSPTTFPGESTVTGVDNAWLSKQSGSHDALSFLVDTNTSSTQTWNAFDEHIANAPLGTQNFVPRIVEEQLSAPKLPTFGIPDTVHKEPEAWSAFSDPIGNVPQATHVSLPKASEEHGFVPQLSAMDLNPVYKASEVIGKDALQSLAVDDFATFGVSFDRSSAPSSMLDIKGRTTLQRTSTNPFEFLDDSYGQENNVFLDMSSLQTALPCSELPNSLHVDFPQAWYPQNSVMTFVSPVPQGGMAYMPGQLPGSPLRELHSQGPAAPVSGNPFA